MTTCLRDLARVAWKAGELARARSLAEEDLELATSFGEQVEQALARHVLGDIDFSEGDLDGARAQFEQGLALGRWEPPPPSVPALLLSLGLVVEVQGDIDRLLRSTRRGWPSSGRPASSLGPIAVSRGWQGSRRSGVTRRRHWRWQKRDWRSTGG